MRPPVAGPPGDQDLVLGYRAPDGSRLFKMGPQTRKASARKAWKKTGKIKQGVSFYVCKLFSIFKIICCFMYSQ